MKAMQGTEAQLIGDSNYFQDTLEQVTLVAPLNKPVLIIGERGTGKELIAARLHYLSKRWDKPLVKVNCAALTESLLESELFGHEVGAFTGASKRHVGRFERANQGTLFLDELANTSMRLQEKLLRVIEYHEYERVGGSQIQHADVRIIAATNVDLPDWVAQGKFRADLLDRLAFAVITLPPLRERGDDILQLAEHFAVAMVKELEWPYFPGFTPTAKQQMLDYLWPGNVRELKNVVERSIYKWAKPSQAIAEVDFNPFASPYRPKINYSKGVKNFTASSDTNLLAMFDLEHNNFRTCMQKLEILCIKEALRKHRHNQRKVAQYLGLTYDQLRGYLRKYAILVENKHVLT